MVGQCGACAVSTGYIAPKLQLRHAYVRTYRYVGLHWPERAARRCLLMRLLCSATQDQAAGGRCSSFVFATSPSTDQILPPIPPYNSVSGPWDPDVISAGPGRLRLHLLLPQARSKMVGRAGGQAAWHSTSANLHMYTCGYCNGVLDERVVHGR